MSESKSVQADERTVLVIVLRRDPDQLTPAERLAIEAKFAGYTVIYRRTDPVDYREHAADCASFQPAAVILPLERPIPSLAMERGFPHLAFVGSSYLKLLPLQPQFEEFNPTA